MTNSSLFALLIFTLSPLATAQTSSEVLGAAESLEKRVLSRGELRVPSSTRTYSIKLPTGEALLFDSVDVRENAGVTTVQGKSGDATLLLTTDGTRGFGYVLKGDKQYVIDTVGQTASITAANDFELTGQIINGWGDDFVVNHQLILEQSQQYAAQGDAVADSQVLSIVDVAFFYDQSVADDEGLQGPRTRAQAAVDYTNAAIAAHNDMLELRVVYVGALSSPLAGADPWNHFVADSDKWTTAGEFGADLLHYIYPYGGQTYCGRGYLPGRVAVSGVDCNIVNETIAHEIGHNLGLHHDRANASSTGLPYSDYNYGYICGNAGTIMAYYNPTLPHYSTPLLQNAGEDCGVDIGQPDAAYNGAVLDITRTSTESYSPTQTTVGNVWIDTVGPIQMDETDGTPIQVTVMRDGDLNEATSVEIGAIETVAMSGRDFTDFVERLEFGPGESTKQIAITLLDDEAYEPDPEAFDVVIRYPYKLDVTGAPLTIEISSDDPDRGIAAFSSTGIGIFESQGMLTIQVDRVGPTDLELTVDMVLTPSTAVAGTDYTDVSGPLTFGVGETSTTFDVPIIDDAVFDGETYVLFFARLEGDNVDLARDEYAIWVWNDDLHRGQGRFASDVFYVTEDAATLTIDVERINGDESSYQYCVQYDMDGTAIAGVDYEGGFSACTSMASGQTTDSITTDIYDNAEADGEKYFDVNFYPYSNDTAEPTQARVYIIDDDAPTPSGGSIQFGLPEYSGDEEALLMNVPVSRVGGSVGTAVADYATSQDTAISGFDYTDVAGTLIWDDGDATDKIVQIPIIDDSDAEPDESLVLALSNILGAAEGSPVTTAVTINASDGPPPIPGIEYESSDFNNRASNPTLIDFEGYATPGNFVYLGDPGQFSEAGLTIANNSQMFLQNNNGYGTSSFLSPQGANPHVVDITLPPDTLAVGFWYSSAAATVQLDGGQFFDLPAVGPGVLGFFGVAREMPIQSLQIVVDGPGIDIDDLVYSDSFQFVDLLQLVTLPDITGDTIEDIAVMREGSILAEIRSGSNGALQKTITFLDDGFTPISAVALPDSDGNGIAELGVLASRNSDGRIIVEIRNLSGAESPRSVWFAANHTAVDMTVIEDDADNNGVAELAVLSRRNSDGRGLVEVKNAFGATNPTALWAGAGLTSTDVEVIADKDANGVPEIAILSTRDSDGRIVAEIKNAAGATLPTAVWFAPGHTAIDMVAVDDKDANGIPEVAVLSRRDSDGRNVVETKNASGPTAPSAVWFAGGMTATAVQQIHDADNNGIPEVAVLSERDSDGRIVVEVKNVFGATNPNPIWYSPGFDARGLATIADTDSNGIEEALVLMIRDSDGRILVQGRNAAGSPAPKDYWFSP